MHGELLMRLVLFEFHNLHDRLKLVFDFLKKDQGRDVGTEAGPAARAPVIGSGQWWTAATRQSKWLASVVALEMNVAMPVLFSSAPPMACAIVSIAITPGRFPAASIHSISFLQSSSPVPRFGATSIRSNGTSAGSDEFLCASTQPVFRLRSPSEASAAIKITLACLTYLPAHFQPRAM